MIKSKKSGYFSRKNTPQELRKYHEKNNELYN